MTRKDQLKIYEEYGIKNIDSFDYHLPFQISMSNKNKKGMYYEIACSFDIETTTLRRGDKNLESKAFMYKWMCAIEDQVIFGDYWEEFIEFCNRLQKENELSENLRLVFYVHNLAFEFQFMRNFFTITESFFRKERKPLYFLISQGIEFRCSYFLSNMSLKKWCENTPNVTHGKLDGELDYDVIRTPKTILRREEIAYMYNDVMGVVECIREYRKEFNISNMPLTSTAFVRHDFRSAMNNETCRKWFTDSALTLEQYEYCKKSFMGGVTHANRFMTFLNHQNVNSYDFKSSYPARMLLNKFPYGKFIEQVRPDRKFFEFLEDKNYLYVGKFYVENFKIKEHHPMPYLSISKCDGFGKVKIDNGKILEGDSVLVYLTNVDVEILKTCYDLEEDSLKCVKCFYCRSKQLPIEFRKTLIEYYRKKCELPPDSYEYMKSKNKLNSSYGMMVTDIFNDEIVFINNQFSKKEINLEEKLKKFYKSRNNFLPYQCGVFVTAYARQELYALINYAMEHTIYVDTDSIKVEESFADEMKSFIQRYNEKVHMQFQDYDLEVPLLDQSCMGQAEHDAFYKEFMTLGAKKYAYVDEKDQFHITVSGIPKKEGAEAIGNLENFSRLGYTYTNIGKNKVIYNDVDDIFIMQLDLEKFSCGSNIALVPGEYTMGISKTYFECLCDIFGKNFLDFFLMSS